ncbi:non-canonical purine NTP pyrophosphatase [Nocardioides pacificus]
MSRVFLASRNRKKIVEMQRLLSEHAPCIEVLGIDDVEGYDEPVEDQATFAGNALLKARAGVAATGMPSLADDSGLCVDALNGMPGVLSARWSGDADAADKDLSNNRLLLAQLRDVPDERRGAHFACAVALCLPGGDEQVVEGRMSGRVIREMRGEGGFGYDVLFVADEHADAGDPGAGLTSAQLSPADKDAISHRGRALREIAPAVAAALGD